MPYLNTIPVPLCLFSGSACLMARPAVDIEFMPSTPDQMSAFHEARGFPAEMIDLLSKQCFITVRIHNTGKEIVWLDLEN